jgi:hypothetical protein
MLLFSVAFALELVLSADVPVDVAIVPGCPSESDGRLSTCQWRRVLWAHHLYAAGLARNFIVSGNAVQNPYVEAEALEAALVALGVPPERIHIEPMALHTDENIAYALTLADASGYRTFSVASDAGQASGACQMVREWSGHPCAPATLEFPWMRARLAMGVPVVRTSPVSEWMALGELEARIAAVTGRRKRPSSMWVYLGQTVVAAFGQSAPPPPPPATY